MDSINNKLEENKRPSVMLTLNQCQVERSAVHGIPTWRNISTSAKCNQNVCKQYTSEVEDTTELGTCFGEDEKLGVYNPTELLHKLCEVMIRFDANPKFYLKSDYLKLIEVLKEIISSILYTNNSNSFGGVVTNTTFNPIPDNEKKTYIPVVSGEYPNFIDEEGNPLTVEKEELVNSIIVFNAIVKEKQRFFEKINIPINTLDITLLPTFRTAKNSSYSGELIINNKLPDKGGKILDVSDNLILFNLNVDKKWLKENLDNITINFYRVINKYKRLHKVSLGKRNKAFTILNDSEDGRWSYNLKDFHIKPVKLSACDIVINLRNKELIKAHEANFDEFNEIWFVLPVSSYKFFRRLFSGNTNLAENIINATGCKLSGSHILFKWHAKEEHPSLHLKFPIGINFLYKVNKIKKYTDIELFFIHFKRTEELNNCYYSK